MSALRSMILICILTPVVTNAQSAATPIAAESSADAAYTAHQWTEAEALYTTLVQEQTQNPRFCYRLGVSARATKHFELALTSFGKAKELGTKTGLPSWVTDYETAITYAAMGDATHAFASLKAAADAGYIQVNRLDSDHEWDTLRTDPQFTALVKQVQHNATPCDDAKFREFDFWLGDWDVTAAAGGPQQGTSHISKEMNGCVIWENWTSAANGYFGKSYNTYNVNLGKWEQYWVDSSAGVIFFSGNLKDGVMDYWTDDVPQPNGTKLRRHLQFFNLSPDKVRQFSQGSTDGGKTWNVEYDFIYNRHVAAQAAAPGK